MCLSKVCGALRYESKVCVSLRYESKVCASLRYEEANSWKAPVCVSQRRCAKARWACTLLHASKEPHMISANVVPSMKIDCQHHGLCL
jgi:hypothetical protein